MVQTAGKSARKGRQKPVKKKKKIVVHHKADYSHVKSKTDSHHDIVDGSADPNMSRHEQLRNAQQQYRRQQHHSSNTNSIVIGESSFPVTTHSLDLSEGGGGGGGRGGGEQDINDDYDDYDDYGDNRGYYRDSGGGGVESDRGRRGDYVEEDMYFSDGEYEREMEKNDNRFKDEEEEEVVVPQHDMDTLMKMYYHGEQAMTTLPDGRLGLNDLMELQHALESRDGGEQNLDDDMTVLPHVMPHTLDDQDDDATYERNVRALEKEYQRLGGAST